MLSATCPHFQTAEDRAERGCLVGSMQPITFGQLLRRYRRAARLSQEALAAAAGLGVHTIADLERGVTHYPQPHTIAALADALRLTDDTRAAFDSAGRRRAVSLLEEEPTSFDMSPHAPRFVGRARERALSGRLLAGEGPPLLLFSGEPGIGKSRLLTETAAHARAAGWRVLAGGCDQRSGREPYAPFVELLATAALATPRAQRASDLKECRWLARLVPELAELAPAPVSEWARDPAQERRLMFSAVKRYLDTIAGPAGTLLLLDDLHWAGADALDLLAFLVQATAHSWTATAPPVMRLRIAGAYRSSEAPVGHPLDDLLLRLTQQERVRLCGLDRFTAEEARLLLSSMDSLQDETAHTGADGWAHEVIARAEGVPLYLVTFAQVAHPDTSDGDALKRTDAVERRSAGQEGIPWLITAQIRQRVNALTPEAHETLAVAALIGRVAPLSLLHAALTSPEEVVVSALEAACHAHLLEEASGTTVAYQFTHDLIRETMVRSLSKARMILLHRRIGAALEQALAQAPAAERVRQVAALAQHLAQAGELARALPYLLEAGDRAEAVYAHAEAEAYYRRARDLAAELRDAPREAAALERVARVLYNLNRLDDTLDTCSQGIVLHRALGDTEGEARMVWLLGWAHVRRGTPQEGVVRLLPLVKDLRRRGVSPRALVWLQLVLFCLCEDTGKGETLDRVGREALATAEQVVAFARTTPDLTLLTDALGIVAKLSSSLGTADAELRALEEVVALDAPAAEEWSQGSQAGALTIPVYGVKALAYVYTLRGRFDESGPLNERALAQAIRSGAPNDVRSARTARGELAFLTGDWAQARADFEQAEDVIRKLGAVAGMMVIPQFELSVAEGGAEVESAELMEYLARGVKAHHFDPTCRAQSTLAERDLLDGRVASARNRLQPLLDEHGAELDEDNLIGILTQLARVNLELGEVARAEEQVAESRSHIERTGWRLYLVDALRTEALIRTAQQRWLEAEAALEETLAMCRAMPYPYAEAKALYVYGQLHAAKGEPQQAREQYQAALEICDRIGEGLYRPHIERALTRLGRVTARVRRNARANA
jgi:tetratricopeptide (TPR) repeat protein/transcriptional regulator with XRE-family HTH domain